MTTTIRNLYASPKQKTRTRDDHQWIAELTGQSGVDAQQNAYKDLTTYLYVCVYNYLHKRHRNVVWLQNASEAELSMVTEDIVQSCMERITNKHHALLKKYSGRGRFTSWAAQVCINATRSEFRRVSWNRNQRFDDAGVYADKHLIGPEGFAQRACIYEVVSSCMARLPDNYRIVLERCIMNGESAGSVAQDLNRSTQAVYNLVSRAKQAMVELLASEDLGADTLSLLSE